MTLDALPADLDPRATTFLTPLVTQATTRLVSAARANLDDLGGASSLAGWSRLMVLAHLRYVASAMHRMTTAALEGRSEPMYPGGREQLRPRTIVPEAGESAAVLVNSLEEESAALDAIWATLSQAQWQTRIHDPDHGDIPLSRLLVLRLTEAEVHGSDLDLPGPFGWDARFLDLVLPLRVKWLDRARHRPDADLSVDGSWLLDDGSVRWIVVADGRDIHATRARSDGNADCRIRGTGRDLLALLLGRSVEAPLQLSGDVDLAQSFKRAFPGP